MITDGAPSPPRDPNPSKFDLSPKLNEMESDDDEVEFSEEPSKPEMYRSYVTEQSRYQKSPNRHRMAESCSKSQTNFNRVVNDNEFAEIVDRAKLSI